MKILENDRVEDPDVAGSIRRGPSEGLCRLLVVIPCLNEEMTISAVVSAIPDQIDGIDTVDTLVFDDGSEDETASRAIAAGAAVIRHRSTRGLGATFGEAVANAVEQGVDIMVHIDGDGQFDARDISKVVAPVVNGVADMVTASRFLEPELEPEMPRVKRWGNRGVASIVRLLTGQQFHDVSCGFRAYSRETLLRMNLFGTFTYTQESFLDLIFKNLTIMEVPVEVRGVREFGESRVASNVVRYGFRSLKIMLRAFISYKPFRFFSSIAIVCLVFGFALLGFLCVHYLRSGAFSPHIWAGFVGGSFCFLGLTTLITGLIGDMLVRIRINQEEILYRLKKSEDRGATNIVDDR